jgi:hypothetical protein
MPVLAIESADDPLIIEACETFSGGQNSFTRAALLGADQASLLENVVTLISGEVRKRRGTRNIFSGYVAGSGITIQNLLWFDTVSNDRLVAFAGGKAYYFTGSGWALYFDAQVDDPNEKIDLVQLTDLIYWTDSTAGGLRQYDGAVFTLPGTPEATILESHTGRLVASGVAAIPDIIYFSDFLDGETWDMVNDAIRIGGGKGDPIVGVESWQDSILVVLCRQSVHLIEADPLTTVANMVVKKIDNSVGCVARRTACQVGQDMWFLSRNGVMSVQKQLATSNNMIPIPSSQPVQNVIERIRWEHAHKSCAICYNNFYLLSVPVDSDEPDTIIVYHYLTGGFTVFKGWDAQSFIEQPFEGTTRVVMGCSTGDVREWLDYLRESQIEPDLDYKDGLASLTLPLTLPAILPLGYDTVSTVVTRAMTFGDPLSTKAGWYLELEFAQSSGTLDVYVILDGDQKPRLRAYQFDVSGAIFPVTFPFTFPVRATWLKRRIPLHQLQNFYEIQFKIVSTSGEMKLRRVAVSAMMNAYDMKEN